jgi:hypothetical protein
VSPGGGIVDAGIIDACMSDAGIPAADGAADDSEAAVFPKSCPQPAQRLSVEALGTPHCAQKTTPGVCTACNLCALCSMSLRERSGICPFARGPAAEAIKLAAPRSRTAPQPAQTVDETAFGTPHLQKS